MRINPQQLGFDFDGVIADIGEAFLRLACQEHGYCSLRLADITSFEVEMCTLIPENIVQKIFADILEDSLATELLPLPGAILGLTKLAQFSKITIITARDQALPVSDWLDHYLSTETCMNINLIAMGDHDQKVGYINDQKLHYFIDDRAETCQQIKEAGLTPLLFRQPWNSTWNGFATVENWTDIEQLIEVE